MSTPITEPIVMQIVELIVQEVNEQAMEQAMNQDMEQDIKQATAEPKDETKDETTAETKDETKDETKAETTAEPNAETKDETKDDTNAVAGAKAVAKPGVKAVKKHKPVKKVQYSYAVRNLNPSPGKYSATKLNGVWNINVRSDQERLDLLEDVKSQSLQMEERIFKKFVPYGEIDGEQIIVSKLVWYIYGLVDSSERTKSLTRSFEVTKTGGGFLVATTSCDVSNLLATDKLFKPYRKS